MHRAGILFESIAFWTWRIVGISPVLQFRLVRIQSSLVNGESTLIMHMEVDKIVKQRSNAMVMHLEAPII